MLLLRLLSYLLLIVSSVSSFQAVATTGISFISTAGGRSRDATGLRLRGGDTRCWKHNDGVVGSSRSIGSSISSSATGRIATTLLSSSKNGEDRPPPRRTLTKRKNKRTQRINQLTQGVEDYNNPDIIDEDDIEVRPIRRRDAIEAGLDYWIDESDLEKERARKVMLQQRRRVGGGGGMEQQISREKLKEEMVAPYKQNWIGLLSVGVVLLSAVATKFPELLMVPIIPIPDL